MILLVGCGGGLLENGEVDVPTFTKIVSTKAIDPTKVEVTILVASPTSEPSVTPSPNPTATSEPTPLPSTTVDPTTLLVDAEFSTGWSAYPSVSSDGRYVVFHSSGGLVVGDTNGAEDVFLRDRQRNTTRRISVSAQGEEANRAAIHPDISADGRFVTFASTANNLVAGDANGKSDIFVYDSEQGTLELISVSSEGEASNGDSDYPSISADGRAIVFESRATNLAPDGTNLIGTHIFYHDRATGITVQVDVNHQGQPANGSSNWPDISADSRYIVFSSEATNLSDTEGIVVYRHDIQTRKTTPIGQGITPVIAPDGNFVAYLSTESEDGLYLHLFDVTTGGTQQLGWVLGGYHGWLNGRQLSLTNGAEQIVFRGVRVDAATGEQATHTDIFLIDHEGGTAVLTHDVVAAELGSGEAMVSADSCLIVFQSRASAFVPTNTNSDGDIYLYDCHTNTFELISVPNNGR